MPLPALKQRVQAQPDRGIAFGPGQTLDDVYRERRPLYQRYADVTVECDALSPEAVCAEVLRRLHPGNAV